MVSLTFVALNSFRMRLFRGCISNGKAYILTMEVSGWDMVKDKIIKGEDTKKLRDQDRTGEH